VLAGNDAARDDAVALLAATGRTVVPCANVMPRRGELVPGPARAAVAELYAQHVLGGRSPAAAPRFRRLVRVGTPDAVGGGAALLARMLGVRVLVVDVGCATTDVHVAEPPSPAAEKPGPRLTAEGDLGMRAAAAGVLVEGQAEGVVDPVEADLLGPTVERITTEVGYVPRDAGSAAEDRRIAALAAVLAVRRHRVAHAASGRALRDIGLLVLTGGVFRRPDANGLGAVVATLRNDTVLAPLLADARVAVDADFVVTPAGLLAAAGRTDAARALLHDHLLG
jgi:ADP-dependent NAD(P)H-hydrate dehydratase / NAD(P)H-hydrate epimerase